MSLLASLFSAIDSKKRELADVVGNPVESLMQKIGDVNDRARTFNELTDAVHAESMASGRALNMDGPATAQLMQTLAESYNPMAMTVYHGSPHLFSRFDASKIGTGEGAQAYGHGLYFAQSPQVAQQYQKDLSKGGDLIDGKPINALYDKIQRMADRMSPAKAELEYEKLGFLEDLMQQSDAASALKRLDNEDLLPWARDIAKRWKPGGNLYTVDLPDEQIAKMLDWDKPLSQQPKNVKKALQNSGLTKYADDYFKANKKAAPTGADLHDFLKYSGYDQGELAAKMAEQGLPGIRYLDQGSRGVGQGTSNFVVFPGMEDILRIEQINGMPPGSLFDMIGK